MSSISLLSKEGAKRAWTLLCERMMEQRSKTSISFFTRTALTLLLAVLFSLEAVGQNSNEVPHYNLDYIKGGTGYIFIQGWAVDKAYPDRSIGPEFIFYSDAACNNRVWRDGAQLVYRPDVNAQYNTTGDHGFEAAILVNRFSDFQFPEGATEHTFYVRIFVNNTSQKVFEMEGGPFPVTVKKIWGEGTEEAPFLICNSGEWDALADDMADDIIGDFYADKFYELANEDWCQFNNSTAVTKMWGIRPFTGHFDGNGKTLNVNLSDEDLAAPFVITKGATIQDLIVSGTINSANFAGGIVGYAVGKLSMDRCIFEGSISGFKHFAGGLLGFGGDMTLNIHNCLFKGSFSPGSLGKYHPIACKDDAATAKAPAASGLYYLNTVAPSSGLGDNVFIGAEGFPVNEKFVDGVWDDPVTAIDGQTYYAAHFTGQELPYEYGFENNDLSAAGWTVVNPYSSTGIDRYERFDEIDHVTLVSAYTYKLQYVRDGYTGNQYLITPEFNGHSGITVIFYHWTFVTTFFQVGYSTTTSDLDAFVWDDPIRSQGSAQQLYEKEFPMGTRFIAIRRPESEYPLWLDDFKFLANNYPSPTCLSVDDFTENTASLSWKAPISDQPIMDFAYQYKKVSEENWSAEIQVTGTSVTIDGLAALTDYEFRVKALYGEQGASDWQSIPFATATGLPFECGFENGMTGWSTVDSYYWSWNNYTGITSEIAHDGGNGFKILSGPTHQYLISPQIFSTTKIDVSFYYLDIISDGLNFQVGYSTKTSDISDFTWGNVIFATDTQWTQYEQIFPEGTKYVAIRYNFTWPGHNGTAKMFFDDFDFKEYSPYAKPTDLTVCNLTDQSASLAWTAPNGAKGYAYQYKKVTDGNWSDEGIVNAASVTLSGLEANTTYDFRVRTLYEESNTSTYVKQKFLTEATAVTSLPFTEGFENGMGGWRAVGQYMGIDDERSTNKNNIHDGNLSFYFQFLDYSYTRYLISPRLDVTGPIKVSFYHIMENDPNLLGLFRVGYSTTGKDLNDFTWIEKLITSGEWNKYTTIFPEGTKYVAISWLNSHAFSLDDFSFELSSINPTELQDVTAIDVTATSANITWTGEAENFEVNFREKARFHDDFEGGITQWTAFERTNVMFRSGDDTSWQWANPNNKNGIAASINYYTNVDDDNNPTGTIGVYDMDDWIISPKIPLTGTLTFNGFFYPLSDEYDEMNDKCEVLVSTTADDLKAIFIDPSIFTAIDQINPTFDNTGQTNISFSNITGFHKYSLDSYNGQEGYIAFRHKSAHKSMFYIDNVCVYRTTDDFTTYSTTQNNLRMSGLEPQTGYDFQVRSLLFGKASNWSALDSFTTEDIMPLSENSDNTQIIAALADGKKHDVILQGHTFHRHRNEWNTLCLPFSVSDFSGTPLEGATVKTLSGSDFTDGTLALDFTEATGIEAGRPYIVTWANGADLLINSNQEWTAFANRVNNGETFAGKNVLLGADITVATMAGTADHPFCGTFDGNGHAIDLYINDSDADYAAPFRYINGATICNVKVTGSVKGGDYCAGLVGAAIGGTNSIHDCWMAASVDTYVSHIGGILGHGTTSFTIISKCYLNGSLHADTIGVFYGGGSDGGTHTLTNCWANGSYNTLAVTGILNLLVADGGTVSVTNCRHHSDAIAQGSYVTVFGSYAFRDFLGSQWSLDSNGNLVLNPSSERAAADIENPVFYDVTLSGNTPVPDSFTEGQFLGSYNPIANTSDWLLDAHNAGNGAFHAAISLNKSSLGSDFVDWYFSTSMTAPATTIPFDTDGQVTLYAGWRVELADAADNSGTIDAIIGSGKANNKIVVLNGRTFYHDGDWNTLCLPFSVSSFGDTPLEGATVMKLASSDLTGSTLTLNFTEVTSIEAGQPYIVKWQDGINLTINSDNDWAAFAQRVASGETFAGKNVLLGADINVSAMVGTADYPFCGTFDGAGHTINVSIDQTGADYAAPFRYIKGATIRSVKVTGSVKGGDYCAGLVGAAIGGTNSIHDCWMAASVDTYDSHIGGILGHGTISATTVSNCYLNGSLHATFKGIFYGGGSDGGTHTLTQSWFMGNYSDPIMTGALDLLIADGGTINVTNCRKTTDNNITQGETIIFSNEALVQFLGSQWTLDGNGMAVLKQTTTLLDSEIHNPVFTGVTINSAAPTAVTSQDGRVTFVGNYGPFVIDDSNIDEIIYLGSNNTIGYASAPRTLRAFRAHFVVSAGSASHAAVRQVLFNDGTTTAVIPIAADVKDAAAAEGWYTIQGIKLNGMPTEKGLYIHNGSKVSIK